MDSMIHRINKADKQGQHGFSDALNTSLMVSFFLFLSVRHVTHLGEEAAVGQSENP